MAAKVEELWRKGSVEKMSFKPGLLEWKRGETEVRVVMKEMTNGRDLGYYNVNSRKQHAVQYVDTFELLLSDKLWLASN